MKITEILDIDSIKINLNVDSKNELLEQMMFLADKSGKVIDREEAKQEVFEREKIMSTGVGKGIALPHAKTNAISKTIGAIAILSEPVDYDSLDGKPVNIVFLLLGMENNVGNHLRLLSKISRLMNNDSFRGQLLQSQSSSEILDLFRKFEEKE
ncbi:PTS sugar transporter subunit IIA [Bacteroidota bacterium]